jgi:hypothetical protein
MALQVSVTAVALQSWRAGGSDAAVTTNADITAAAANAQDTAGSTAVIFPGDAS